MFFKTLGGFKMKKLAILLLTICLAFTMAACGPRLPINNDSGTTDGSNNGSNDGDNASSNNWADFYTSYADAMSDAYDSIDSAISEDNFMYAMDMLNFMSGDLELAFTSMFFAADEESALGAFFLFGEDLNYDQSGDTATLSGVDSEGVEFSYELKYDPSSASALLTVTEGGTVSSILSICVEDEFYAKTYWTPDYGNVEVIAFTNGDMLMSWDNAPAAAGETLYKNVGYASSDSFAQSMANYLNYVGGVTTGSSDSGF